MLHNFTSKKSVTNSLGSLIAAGSASAAIQYIDTAGFTTVGNDITPNSIDWNIDQTGAAEASWFNSNANTGKGSIFASAQANSFSFMVVPVNTSGSSVDPFLNNVNVGYMISSGRQFNTYANPIISSAFYMATGFTDGVEGIFGFKFSPDSTTFYGWAHITFDLETQTATITDWAYDDSGASIPAGTIPEPATTALGLAGLALGVAGLSSWRKRKQAA